MRISGLVTIGAVLSGVAAITLVGPSGCSGFDHPGPLPNEVPNLGVLLQQNAVAAGAGGAGGGPADLCVCVASLNDPSNLACGDCIANLATSTCVTQADACAADSALGQGGSPEQSCADVQACLKACQSSADPVPCSQACVLPFTSTPGRVEFGNVLACACELCGSACNYTTAPATCGVDGTGGSGGAGGASGGGGGASAVGGAGGH
ncbi:MAG TPA: hypothetical protein VGM56_11855 [Byssovorax sp.]|jgi:hypothetical protein